MSWSSKEFQIWSVTTNMLLSAWPKDYGEKEASLLPIVKEALNHMPALVVDCAPLLVLLTSSIICGNCSWSCSLSRRALSLKKPRSSINSWESISGMTLTRSNALVLTNPVGPGVVISAVCQSLLPPIDNLWVMTSTCNIEGVRAWVWKKPCGLGLQWALHGFRESISSKAMSKLDLYIGRPCACLYIQSGEGSQNVLRPPQIRVLLIHVAIASSSSFKIRWCCEVDLWTWLQKLETLGSIWSCMSVPPSWSKLLKGWVSDCASRRLGRLSAATR